MSKLKIEIKDVPYIFIEEVILSGPLEQVANNILDLKNKVKEAYYKREENVKNNYIKDMIPSFTPFEDYKYIELDYNYNHDDFDLHLRVYRDETDEEYNKRIELNKKRSEAAKIAAKNRKEAQEKRELSLLKTLKEKYEKNG